MSFRKNKDLMSSSSSQNRQNEDIIKIKDLSFENISDKLTLIKPKDSKVRNNWKDIISNVGGNWKVNKGGWILPTNRLKELKIIERELGQEIFDDEKSDISSDDETSSESSSTDDEMIQKVLARRLKSESTQDEIQDENISDSENEDVLSLCRRIRHLYREINDLKQVIKNVKGN